MDFITVIILSIIEGVTEFLPISSTGHLILTSHLLNLTQTDFLKTFEISIQLGAILSVGVVYWRELLVKLDILKKVLFAFLPTGVFGLAFYKIVKTYLMGNNLVVLWSLLLGGIFLIVFEYFYSKDAPLFRRTFKCTLKRTHRLEDITYKQAFKIGLFQSIAMIPGVSRSASTIVGGLFLGLSRQTIVEFSFLLAVPTMVAATGLDLLKNYSSFESGQLGLLGLGLVVSFLVALASIKFLLVFIKKHTFVGFGVYRIVLALLFLIFLY